MSEISPLGNLGLKKGFIELHFSFFSFFLFVKAFSKYLTVCLFFFNVHGTEENYEPDITSSCIKDAR